MALVGTHRVPYPRTPKAFGFPKSFPKNHSPFFQLQPQLQPSSKQQSVSQRKPRNKGVHLRSKQKNIVHFSREKLTIQKAAVCLYVC
jgi:hypothetical protein